MQEIIKALVWTFIHSLWQGFIAALLAAIIISATRKATARLRYNLLGMLLVLFLVSTCITFFTQLAVQTEIPVASPPGTILISNNIIAATVSEGFVTDLTSWVNNNTGSLLIIWTLFFLLNCLKLFTGLAAVHRLRNYKTHPVTEQWKIKLKNLQNSLVIRQSISLLQSELVKVPVALGFFKPVILLPVGLITYLPAEQVEAILLHELGHICRRDYLVNFIQHFAEAIFFFNPAMRWISSLIRQEREACCDDIAVENSGQKRQYLDALVNFQEYSFNHSSYAMAISSKKQYLLNRVNRILTNENKKLNLFEKAALLSGVLLFSAFTYISKGEKVNAPVEQAAMITQPIIAPQEKISTVTPVQLAVHEKKKSKPVPQPVMDTLPPQKNTAKPLTPLKNKQPLTIQKEKENVSDADKALQEIIKIKEQIGATKESIGKKKELLNKQEGKNTNKKTTLTAEIEKERGEIEVKRGDLERKRAEYESLKNRNPKKNENENEKEQEQKAESKFDNDDRKIITKEANYSVSKSMQEFKFHLVKENKFDYRLKEGPKIKIAPQKADEQKAPQKIIAPNMKTPAASPVRV